MRLPAPLLWAPSAMGAARSPIHQLSCAALVVLLGCKPSSTSPPPSPTDSSTPTSSGTTSSGTDTATTSSSDTATNPTEKSWVSLPAHCDPPTDTSLVQPIEQLGEDQHTQNTFGEWFVELVDVELDQAGETLWGVGQGGMMAYDVRDPTAPTLVGRYPDADKLSNRFYRIELVDSRAYATHRDRGLSILDIQSPEAPTLLGELTDQGLEGMAHRGDRLYIVSLEGFLAVYDISSPEAPVQIARIDGLGSAWDIVLDGDIGYISDNELGVVVVDLSDPDAPVLGQATDVGGGVQDIALGDGMLYAAAGGVGVVVLDRSDPSAPVVTEILDYGASVQSVAVDSEVLWAVNQEDVIAIDIRDPGAPVPLNTVESPEFAMHVTARSGLAYVGDWSRMGVWTVDTSVLAPDLDPAYSERFLRGEAESFTIELANTGAADLILSGAEIDDSRFTLLASRDTIPPGERGTLQIDFSGGEDILATLCIASNDPDSPTLPISLHSGDGGIHDAIGSPAPDFVLDDLDGVSHQLSDQLGHPVVLVYFATW